MRLAPVWWTTILWAALAAAGMIAQAPAPVVSPPVAAVTPPAPADSADEEETPPPDAVLPELVDAVSVDEGLSARFENSREIVFTLQLDSAEPADSIARRICGDAALATALLEANGGGAPSPGRPVVIPWALARAEYRYLALRAIFVGDRRRNGAWEHRPREGRLIAEAEGLWQVALWFTGDGEKWRDIARVNGLDGPLLPPEGQPVRIPDSLLLPLFQRVTQGPANLRYGEDDEGPYAERPLARGEALYSSVVVRFTELTRPDDVNGAAEIIARRSGIRDVRRIEVGQLVRVPLEMLATPFLPENDPRRVLAKLHEAEIAGLAPPTRADALEGVHVLLDPGHGGDDVGAQHGRVWESDYVYDIACRVARLLEQDTSASVHLLVRDTHFGRRVFDRRKLPRNRREVVETEPPHKIRRGETDIAVNLRWYLANSHFRRLTGKEGVPPDKIVFVSLHADSLHRAVRGSMVYVPGERFRPTVQGESGAAYKRYREWREAPQVEISRADRLRDEAASRRLASALLAGLQENEVGVHEDQPIRDRVVRGRGRRRAWLPAVLRGNLVPAKVLLETVNLGAPRDVELIEDPEGRERIARGVVAGLRRFYSGENDRASGRRAAAGR